MVLLPLQAVVSDGLDLVRGAASASTELQRGLTSSRAAARGGPVLLFVAAGDVDALASARVLTALLKADLTRYEVHPVSGYDHLRTKFAALVTGPEKVDPRAVLCINCGAAVDLEKVLALRDDDGEDIGETDVRVCVLDCHRPYHLKNISSNRIILFNDVDTLGLASLPVSVNWEDEWGNVPDEVSSSEDEFSSDDDSLADDYSNREEAAEAEADEAEEEQRDNSDNTEQLAGPEESSAPESDSPEAPAHNPEVPGESPGSPLSPGDNDADEQPRQRKRKRRVRDPLQEEIEEDDVQFDGEGGPQSSDDEDEEVRKGGKHRRSPKRSRRRRSKRRRYDRDPEVEERMRLKEYYSNVTTAMSSAALSHSMAVSMRRSNMDSLWMAILGVTSQYMMLHISNDLYEDAYGYIQKQIEVISPNEEERDGTTSREQGVGFAPTGKSSHAERIAPNEELRLDLLRHWSLHESLMYSPYTATRLSTWRQLGKRRLLEMLATLGIPLKESQEQWCYMKFRYKKALEKHLGKAIMRFDLGESLQYDSFVRSLPGHKGDISAADFALGIAALLEFEDYTRNDRDNRDPSASLVERFWKAYDALDCKRSLLIDNGLDVAVSVQKLTAEIAGDVMERRLLIVSGPFRYVVLRDQQSKEYLAHPLLLRRLALFLTKAAVRQGGREKPCLVVAQDVVRKVWIAVAATAPGQVNDFGVRFRKAAERNRSQITYNGFDSSVCEIPDNQKDEFIGFLHRIMT